MKSLSSSEARLFIIEQDRQAREAAKLAATAQVMQQQQKTTLDPQMLAAFGAKNMREEGPALQAFRKAVEKRSNPGGRVKSTLMRLPAGASRIPFSGKPFVMKGRDEPAKGKK